MASIGDQNREKFILGDPNRHRGRGWHDGYVKPSGRFWKRYFNKKVRKGAVHKRDNWTELS